MSRNDDKSKFVCENVMRDVNEPPITARQREYIRILSSYPSTKEVDEADVRQYLKKVNKNEVSELSRREASELIQILLQRPTEYTFPCGKKATLPKQEVNGYNVLGWLEGCLHACPDNIDVNNCDYLIEHMDELQQKDENE